jgi:transcriptional regulator with XRE-family HTH domain
MTRPIRPSRGSALARRLRELRERGWPDHVVTQRQLADALGGLSVGTISGYENERHPTTPPPHRLRSYATFFATRRSLEDGRARVIPDKELEADELAERDRLLKELLSLASAEPEPEIAGDLRPRSLWTFAEGEPVRIVCGHLSDMTHPYANPRNQNYTELLTYADADALMELYAYLWKLNPACDVRIVRADKLNRSDDLTGHLVMLGGNGLNDAVQWVLEQTKLPVRQVTDSGLVDDGDVFAVDGSGMSDFLPTVDEKLGLVDDVGLFARLRNPYNSARTLTVCSGVFSRGVLGAVRILTDAEQRERNGAYLARRFTDADEFAILMRVQVLLGEAITPDLENPDIRLYEWPDAASGRAAETGERGMGER